MVCGWSPVILWLVLVAFVPALLVEETVLSPLSFLGVVSGFEFHTMKSRIFCV